MEILLKHNKMISEAVLSKENCVEYGHIFEKMGRYAKMSVNSLTESRYHKAYNPDILFNINEQAAVTDLLCTLRMHIFESMKYELKDCLIQEGRFGDFADKLKKIGADIKDKVNKGVDATKSAVNKTVDVIDQKIDKVIEKFKNAFIFLSELIKKGITSVKELLKAFGELLLKLGDNFSSALEKLGAFKSDKKDDETSDIDISKELKAAEIPDNQKTFFTHVVEFVSIAMSNKDYKEKMQLSEGFGDVMNAIGNNKVFQYLFSVSKNRKKWSWIHTILVSLVGTFIISVILPMFMTCLGASASVIVATTTVLACVWNTRSLLRVIFNRWLTKSPGEKFWNWQTVLGVILSTVPMALLQIPAVREWFIDGLTSFCEWLGVDKLINNIEELLGKLVEKCGGTNFTEETVTTPGKYVTELIQSQTNSGDVHIDLMNSGSGHDYISHLFGSGSHIAKFIGDPDALKSWMTGICDAKYTGSIDMLHQMSGSLSSDAPLTAILDGNTFGHISRDALTKAIEHVAGDSNIHCELVNITNDALRDGTSGWAGTAYGLVFDANATTDNAVLINDMIKKVAEEVGVKAGNGYNTFGTIANKLADSVTHWHESVTNIITVHHLFDNIMDCFNPVFNPFFRKDKWGDYKLSLGSNASGYKSYPVTEVKHMTLDEVAKLDSNNPALTILVKHIQDVQKQHKDNIQSGIEQSKKNNNGDVDPKNKKALNQQIRTYSKNNDIAKRELMVICVDVNYKVKGEDGKVIEKKLEKAPAVVMDMLTMYCADIAPWFKKRRKNIYPIMGLLARLDFIPVKKDDNDTKEFIYQMLNKFTETSVKSMVDDGTAGCYITKDGKSFKPSDDKAAVDNYFDMGGFTTDQICEILNGTTDAYMYLDGRYAKNVSIKTDKDGNIKSKTHKDNIKLIEKKRYIKNSDGKFVENKEGTYDYVDARVVPFANKYCIEEIKKDKNLATLFLDDEQTAIDDRIINDTELNIKQWLFRPAKIFSEKDKYGLGKSIKKYLKDADRKQLKNGYILCKKFIEIIWRAMYEQIEKVNSKRNHEG